MTAAQIAQQLRPLLARFPAFRASVTVPAALQIGARASNSSYNLTVRSAEHRRAVHLGAALETGDRASCPKVQDVSDDMEIKSPRVDLVLDRDKAAAVGLSASRRRERALRRARTRNGRRRSTAPRRSTACCSSSIRSIRSTPTRSRSSRSRRRSGALVPLESVVSFKETVGPQTVNHSGQLPAVTISFGLQARRLARHGHRRDPRRRAPDCCRRP